MDILDEVELVRQILVPRASDVPAPLMVQIGANEGMFEYAKEDEKDFVFEFLRENVEWDAVLIEPLPGVFGKLKSNYASHRNNITFLKCAITPTLQHGTLLVSGRDGKASSLLELPRRDIKEAVDVLCLPWASMCLLLDLQTVDFVKIDAEGMDASIVMSILECEDEAIIPDVIFYESQGTTGAKLQRACEQALQDKGYAVYRSGLNRRGVYMDRVAIRQQLTGTSA